MTTQALVDLVRGHAKQKGWELPAPALDALARKAARGFYSACGIDDRREIVSTKLPQIAAKARKAADDLIEAMAGFDTELVDGGLSAPLFDSLDENAIYDRVERAELWASVLWTKGVGRRSWSDHVLIVHLAELWRFAGANPSTGRDSGPSPFQNFYKAALAQLDPKRKPVSRNTVQKSLTAWNESRSPKG